MSSPDDLRKDTNSMALMAMALILLCGGECFLLAYVQKGTLCHLEELLDTRLDLKVKQQATDLTKTKP